MNHGIYIEIERNRDDPKDEIVLFGYKPGEVNGDWIKAMLNPEKFQEEQEVSEEPNVFRERSPSISSLHSISEIQITGV